MRLITWLTRTWVKARSIATVRMPPATMTSPVAGPRRQPRRTR